VGEGGGGGRGWSLAEGVDDNAEAGGRGEGLQAWGSQALVVRTRCV